jgi:hypothetical protein
MRTPTIVSALLFVTACASRQGTVVLPDQTQETVTVTTSAGASSDVRITREDFTSRTEIDAPRHAVWTALPAVFQEIGLPKPDVDAARYIAAVDHVASRTLAGMPMSKHLSCGAGISGAHADTRRIRLTVRTAVISVSEQKTAVQIRVDATATSTDGASAAPIRCTSRGALEALIATKLRDRAGGTQ